MLAAASVGEDPHDLSETVDPMGLGERGTGGIDGGVHRPRDIAEIAMVGAAVVEGPHDLPGIVDPAGDGARVGGVARGTGGIDGGEHPRTKPPREIPKKAMGVAARVVEEPHDLPGIVDAESLGGAGRGNGVIDGGERIRSGQRQRGAAQHNRRGHDCSRNPRYSHGQPPWCLSLGLLIRG